MELRSHTITMYLGALVLVAACSSSNVNSNPFEQATQNPHFDAGAPPMAAPTASAPATGGNDTKGAAGSCSSDSDCGNLCNGAQPCCCDTGSSTCFSPESGTCPAPSGGGGNDATTGGGDDGSSSGDDSGGSMQMMP